MVGHLNNKLPPLERNTETSSSARLSEVKTSTAQSHILDKEQVQVQKDVDNCWEEENVEFGGVSSEVALIGAA